MREKQFLNSFARGIWVTIASIVILTLTGPFGTFVHLPFWERLLFWTVAIFGGTVFIHFAVHYLLHKSPKTLKGTIVAVVGGSVLGAIPATALIMELFSLVSAGAWGHGLTIEDFPAMLMNVTVIAVLVSAAHVMPGFIHGKIAAEKLAVQPTPTAPEPAPAALETVPLLRDLSDGLRPCQIMSFSMQDHYVEVTTTEGKELLLMRLGDAIARLGNLRGERVHRSHWVSLRHLVDVQKDGRRHVAVLTDGRKIPISNPYLECAQNLLKEKGAVQ